MSDAFELVGRGIERISLRTPTLPPATETNSYLIGKDSVFYVVEPATPYGREQRILFEQIRKRAARGDQLVGAIVTHHHQDHIGSAAAFRTEFGVPLLAHAQTKEKLAGKIEVDRTLNDGDALLDDTVRVMHTPGHAPGHICLWNSAAHWLIAGDMVASVGTIIVDPDDDGDMAAYIAQLGRLAELPVQRMFPAHGDPITSPIDLLRYYIAHRHEREAKVLAAVATGSHASTLTDIVRNAYADTPAWLWPLASKSARAHLLKLAREGKVDRMQTAWIRRN